MCTYAYVRIYTYIHVYVSTFTNSKCEYEQTLLAWALTARFKIWLLEKLIKTVDFCPLVVFLNLWAAFLLLQNKCSLKRIVTFLVVFKTDDFWNVNRWIKHLSSSLVLSHQLLRQGSLVLCFNDNTSCCHCCNLWRLCRKTSLKWLLLSVPSNVFCTGQFLCSYPGSFKHGYLHNYIFCLFKNTFIFVSSCETLSQYRY